MLTSGLAGCLASFGGGFVQDHFNLQAAMIICLVFNIIGAAFIWKRSADSADSVN